MNESGTLAAQRTLSTLANRIEELTFRVRSINGKLTQAADNIFGYEPTPPQNESPLAADKIPELQNIHERLVDLDLSIGSVQDTLNRFQGII